MPCEIEITLLDKVIHYIKLSMPKYTYSREDFFLEQTDKGIIIVNWNIENLQVPNIEEIEKLSPMKKCPENCIKCLTERIYRLELKISSIIE